jgi:hypothetical protein
VCNVDVPRKLIKPPHFPGIFTHHNNNMEENKDYQHLQPPEKNASLSPHLTVDLKFSVPWGHIAGIISNQ